jgi:iron complex transport system permease protein
MSVAWALGWELWARNRWVLGAFGAYLLVLAGLARVLPAELLAESPESIVVLVLVPLLVLMFVLLGFSFATDASLEHTASCFPARLLTLPVRTAALAGWPMLYGALTLLLGWVGFAGAVLRPAGVQVPLVWPGLLLAACLCWLQALAWAPYPLPWLRVVVVSSVVPALAGGAMWAWGKGLPASSLASGLVVVALSAYGVALASVARARHDAGAVWTWPGQLRAWLSQGTRSAAAFATPGQALRWLEWRRQRTALLLVALVLAADAVAWAYLIALMPDEPAAWGSPIAEAVARVTGRGWLVLARLCLMPLLLAPVVGFLLGNFSVGSKELTLPALLATRPVTVATLVGAKLRSAARATLLLWAVLLSVALLWAGLAGKYAELAERWAGWYGPGLRGVAALALALAVPVMLSWALMVRLLWVWFTGRAWFIGGAWAVFLACWVGASLLAGWLADHPAAWAALLDALPALLGILVALKLLAAAWLAQRVVRAGLLSGRALAGALLAWVAVVVGLFAALEWLLPIGVVSARLLGCWVVLAVPLAEGLLAPLTLAWNRYR